MILLFISFSINFITSFFIRLIRFINIIQYFICNIFRITNQIHQCENVISSLSFLKTNCEIQKQIKENIKLYLTTKFNIFTRHFKYNQELYIRKYKELGGEHLDKI